MYDFVKKTFLLVVLASQIYLTSKLVMLKKLTDVSFDGVT